MALGFGIPSIYPERFRPIIVGNIFGNSKSIWLRNKIAEGARLESVSCSVTQEELIKVIKQKLTTEKRM